jgi:hypothetical protein
MTRLRGYLPLCAALGALLALPGAREAKAGYALYVTITDNTTHTTTTYPAFGVGNPNNTYPSPPPANTQGITVGGGSLNNTSSTGVSLSGLTTDTTYGATSTVLNVGGSASVVAGNTDSYTVTVTASFSGYTSPTGTSATLTQSESNTYSYTTAGNTQLFQSYYDPTNTLNHPTIYTPGTQTIALSATGSATQSGSQNNPNTYSIATYKTPYALTETITINLTGNTLYGSNNATDGFHGSATITTASVPEPASIVMMLTGMPVPLVVLGFLRRRRRAAAAIKS